MANEERPGEPCILGQYWCWRRVRQIVSDFLLTVCLGCCGSGMWGLSYSNQNGILLSNVYCSSTGSAAITQLLAANRNPNLSAQIEDTNKMEYESLDGLGRDISGSLAASHPHAPCNRIVTNKPSPRADQPLTKSEISSRPKNIQMASSASYTLTRNRAKISRIVARSGACGKRLDEG